MNPRNLEPGDSIWFYMIFILFCMVFVWFYMIFMWSILFLHDFMLFLHFFYIVFTWFLEVKPQFFNDRFFWLLTFFRNSNVRPEIPTTTEIFQWPVFLTINFFPDFERSTGNSDYQKFSNHPLFLSINVFPDFERSNNIDKRQIYEKMFFSWHSLIVFR